MYSFPYANNYAGIIKADLKLAIDLWSSIHPQLIPSGYVLLENLYSSSSLHSPLSDASKMRNADFKSLVVGLKLTYA